MRWLLSGAMIWSLSACYAYGPTSEPIPEMGREVKAVLSTPRDLQSGEIVVRDVTSVEGTVYDSKADTVVIWSEWLRGGRGGRYYANGEIYPFLRENLASLEVRKLNVPRTAVASALAVGLGFSVFAFTADLGGGGSGEPRPPDTQGQVAGSFRGVPTIR